MWTCHTLYLQHLVNQPTERSTRISASSHKFEALVSALIAVLNSFEREGPTYENFAEGVPSSPSRKNQFRVAASCWPAATGNYQDGDCFARFCLSPMLHFFFPPSGIITSVYYLLSSDLNLLSHIISPPLKTGSARSPSSSQCLSRPTSRDVHQYPFSSSSPIIPSTGGPFTFL